MYSLLRAMLGVALLQLAGCAAASRPDITNVEVGMTQAQVESLLGQPQGRERYGGTEFLFYTNGEGTRIPVAVVDGHVTSIGRGAYEVVVRSKAQTNSADAQAGKRNAPPQ